ncbi:hypothetical protein FACS1894163_06590 [Spirochaetia bacterium]|nr:hypothetical protein FACS1894163_06590 [Spirochaetia bacterium]
MKTLSNSSAYSEKLTTEEIIALMNLKDEDIDTSDIPEVTDFSRFHLVNEDELKKIPKEILRAILEERVRTQNIVSDLAKRTLQEPHAV